MRFDSIVYRQLVARIALLGFTRREVADRMGISCGTLHNKLCHVTPFTLDEAILLKQILGFTGPIEEVFMRYDEVQA